MLPTGPPSHEDFAEDADFTNIMGLRAHGRDVIARGHDEILATFFKGTRLHSEIDQIRFVRPDVAVVDASWMLRTPDGEPFPIKRSSMGLVATKDNGVWSIAVLRNMIPFERPVAGPIERSLAAARS